VKRYRISVSAQYYVHNGHKQRNKRKA